MKRSLLIALIAASTGALAAPAFADQAYYPSNVQTPSSSPSGLTRAQVRAQLAAAERDGSLQRLNSTLYRGN